MDAGHAATSFLGIVAQEGEKGKKKREKSAAPVAGVSDSLRSHA